MHNNYYQEDLAYIHDVGFCEYALQSAPAILKILAEANIHKGLLVDLGCGSGISALEFSKANYRVFGVDISEALISIARNRVANAQFRVESLYKTVIPDCQAVTSIGECLNYLFDGDDNQQRLSQLFQRIYQALTSGGIFIFDIALIGQIQVASKIKNFSEGKDWLVLIEKEEDQEKSTLTRRIITLRKLEQSNSYRRQDEVHILQLYKSQDIAEQLKEVGFQVQIHDRYDEYQLPPAHAVFVAYKSG